MSLRVEGPLPGLWVSQQHGTQWWIVREDYALVLGADAPAAQRGVGYTLTIPAGFRYNRASIPDVLAWLVSKDDLGCAGPLVHDALYQHMGHPGESINKHLLAAARENPIMWCSPWRKFTRAEADELFYVVMLTDLVKSWRARLAYWAVRLFARRF